MSANTESRQMRARFLWVGTADTCLAMDTEELVELLTERARKRYQARVSDSEQKSWRASIKTVAEVLVQAGLNEVLMLLEMSTFAGNTRIDIVLLGSHPDSDELSVVAVENKQWSEVHLDPVTKLVVHPGAKPGGSQHPAEQIWDYCKALERHLPMLRSRFHGVVNLHNAPADQIRAIMPPYRQLRAPADKVRVFGKEPKERQAFADFLSQVISAESAPAHLRMLNRAHVRPSDDLMHAVNQAVNGRSFFTLLDEQRVAFDNILDTVEKGFSENNKTVFIIVGGPGTGKSVLALELLGALSGLGSATVHASGSNAFAETLRKHVTNSRESVEDIFTFFHHHRSREPNQLNVLLCDEAHRLRKTSNLQYTRAEDRSDVPQVRELIQAARVPVFFLDPDQVIRRDEVGTPQNITQAALGLGIALENIRVIHLDRQFRHSRCPDYVDWLEDLLGYRAGTPRPWNLHQQYELYLAESPQLMEEYLRLQLALQRTARITAGYCWPWTHSPLPNGALVHDIKIGTWSYPWNAYTGNKKRGIPPSRAWATDPAGFEQVGCIYTAQGFDWDYSGVIIGHDYTWNDNHWLAQKNNDPSTYGAKRHEHIRNVYRVLATRGRRGTVLYTEDPATRALLKSLHIPAAGDAIHALKQEHPNLKPKPRRAPPRAPQNKALFEIP